MQPNDAKRFIIVTFDPSDDGIYQFNLNRLHCGVDKLFVPNDVEWAEICVNGNILSRCAPNNDGEIVFWEDWHWLNSYPMAEVHIKSPTVPTVRFRYKSEWRIVPINIPHYTRYADRAEFRGTSYNNALVFADDTVVLMYSS
jgi:hypothetical protein